MNPKISVIIPVYNVEKYLRECLDSVRAQTFTDLEVICVDDGSTDDSPAILNEYAAKDKRFKVIRQENKGSGPARNVALDNATGECVSFMDPDDMYPEDDVLDKLHSALLLSGCAIAGGNLRRILDDGSCIGEDDNGYFGVMSYTQTQQQYGYQCYLFKRELIERNGIRFPNLWRRQDPPFFVMCMLAAKHYYAIRDVVYTYRTKSSSNRVDWFANGALRLKDNLNGMEMVGRLAKDNGLWRLYAHNFRCLSEIAFLNATEAQPVMKQLTAFVRGVETSGKIPQPEIRKLANSMFKQEVSRTLRYLTIAKVFGFGVATRLILSAIRQRISSF